MTDRDRLIELHEEADKEWNAYFDNSLLKGETRSKSYKEFIADHLLANGVIVLPCKVGDKVYVIYNNKVIKGKVDSFDVVIEESDISYVAGVKFFDQIATVKGFSFGLNVFLTKSQAEEALKK